MTRLYRVRMVSRFLERVRVVDVDADSIREAIAQGLTQFPVELELCQFEVQDLGPHPVRREK